MSARKSPKPANSITQSARRVLEGATAHDATSGTCGGKEFSSGRREAPAAWWKSALRLERVFQRELHDPRVVGRLVQRTQACGAGRSWLTESRQADSGASGAGQVQIRVIQRIENLPSKLHVLAFGDREYSRQRRIEDDR